MAPPRPFLVLAVIATGVHGALAVMSAVAGAGILVAFFGVCAAATAAVMTLAHRHAHPRPDEGEDPGGGGGGGGPGGPPPEGPPPVWWPEFEAAFRRYADAQARRPRLRV